MFREVEATIGVPVRYREWWFRLRRAHRHGADNTQLMRWDGDRLTHA